jgi:hypothetical protein
MAFKVITRDGVDVTNEYSVIHNYIVSSDIHILVEKCENIVKNTRKFVYCPKKVVEDSEPELKPERTPVNKMLVLRLFERHSRDPGCARVANMLRRELRIPEPVVEKKTVETKPEVIAVVVSGHSMEVPAAVVAPRRNKGNVRWFTDIPYKHNEAGEVFEGPVSSQLTYQKEPGEDKPVFVNPELVV